MKKSIYTGLLIAIAFSITGCEDTELSTATGFEEVSLEETYVVKPFTAKYYFEDDGTDPGVGTDGNDTSITPVLKHTETVKRPAISYIYDYEFGINSYNLYAEWEGEIEVSEAIDINASFDVSWSDVSFYIDGELVSKWANSNKVIPLSLSVGTHSVRVEYHNHWHTTGFNVSFTNYRKTDVSEDLSAKISDTTQISSIVAYEVDSSTSIYNEVEITLPLSSKPQLLFLSSHNAINWIIKNPYNTKLEGVVFNSYGAGSTVSNTYSAFVIQATDLSGYGTNPAADITSMTGREPDYSYDDYAIANIEIPGT